MIGTMPAAVRYSGSLHGPATSAACRQLWQEQKPGRESRSPSHEHSDARHSGWLSASRAPAPKGVKVSDAEMAALNIQRHTFQGDWNYTISPRQKSTTLMQLFRIKS
jgi:hypothetical protein